MVCFPTYPTLVKANGYAEGHPSLRVHLCADEVVIVTVDPRTGRLTLRDTGDLAAAGRGPRFAAITEKLNEMPYMLPQALVTLRVSVSTFVVMDLGYVSPLSACRRSPTLPSRRCSTWDSRASACGTSLATVSCLCLLSLESEVTESRA